MPSLLAFASFPLFFALLNGGSCERLICDRFLPCRYEWEDVGTVSDEDLMQVSSELLRKDVGNAAKDIRLRYQARVLSKDLNDEAPKPLMKLNANVFKLPNVAKMKMIFDNFNPDSGESENVTSEHREEQVDLMSSIIFSSVMQTALDFLATNAIITSNKQYYFDLLMEMWFLMFPRTTQDNRGSCAFESIFLAELVHGKILGMNNWIFFSSQEAKKKADYMGYKKIVNLGERGAIVKLRYKWLDVVNPSGYIFVGTSPEFEMALYTICFLTRPNRPCHLSLEGQNVTIITQSVSSHNQTYLGRVSFSI